MRGGVRQVQIVSSKRSFITLNTVSVRTVRLASDEFVKFGSVNKII